MEKCIIDERFEDLEKKVSTRPTSFEEICKYYTGAFFLNDLARTKEQSEFLIRLAISNQYIMQEIVETVKEYYEHYDLFEKEVSEDLAVETAKEINEYNENL